MGDRFYTYQEVAELYESIIKSLGQVESHFISAMVDLATMDEPELAVAHPLHPMQPPLVKLRGLMIQLGQHKEQVLEAHLEQVLDEERKEG